MHEGKFGNEEPPENIHSFWKLTGSLNSLRKEY